MYVKEYVYVLFKCLQKAEMLKLADNKKKDFEASVLVFITARHWISSDTQTTLYLQSAR